MSGLIAPSGRRDGWKAASGQAIASWRMMPSLARAALLSVVGGSLVSAALIGLEVGGDAVGESLAAWSGLVLPVGSGLLLLRAAVRPWKPGAVAWLLIGLGVLLWSVDDAVAAVSVLFGTGEGSSLGLMDVLCVAAYPLVFVGLLLLPHVKVRRLEQARLAFDMTAGTLALSAIAWTFFMGDMVDLDPEASLLLNVVSVAYPLGDLLLLSGLLVLWARRSKYQFDGRLIVLTLAIGLMAFGDFDSLLHTTSDMHLGGRWVHAAGLASYGLFGLAALLLAGPAHLREQADLPARIWSLLAPYGLIAGLFALTVARHGRGLTMLEATSVAVAILVIGRQGVAISETRELVQKQRNDLVASISHELRTPLTAIYGFTEVLGSDPDLSTSERVELVSIMTEQTKYLTRIVGDLLDMARGGLSKTALTRTDLDVRGLVDSALCLLGDGTAPGQVDEDIEPGLIINGDEDRLRQVLVNYLSNAGRYGMEKVDVRAFSEASGDVTIEVHDDGPGIPRKYEVTIWDQFERGPQTGLSEVQGSGLGLAIVRQLVAAHGGRAGHRVSERLGGACFWFTVPAVSAVGEPATSLN